MAWILLIVAIGRLALTAMLDGYAHVRADSAGGLCGRTLINYPDNNQPIIDQQDGDGAARKRTFRHISRRVKSPKSTTCGLYPTKKPPGSRRLLPGLRPAESGLRELNDSSNRRQRKALVEPSGRRARADHGDGASSSCTTSVWYFIASRACP